ncbi:site-2 protease family protein [Kamptonema cortianum]|nr:site-2 protease family protein [Geitlerinema splendidum]MDK3158334.1 site-2 protease family protein [Kamptonema cortianum]
MFDFDITQFLVQLLVLFFAIGIHEYAHAKVADLAGDPTPRAQGRVTLNLTKHFEPAGTFMILITSISGFGIGWGKPVQVNPGRMRDPRWDHFMSVAAGPASNVLQALVYGGILRLVMMGNIQIPAVLASFLLFGTLLNFGLAFFNLIPFGVLDGHWLLGLLLPAQSRNAWFRFNQTSGMMILLVLIVGDQVQSRSTGFSLLGTLIGTPSIFATQAVTGLDLRG